MFYIFAEHHRCGCHLSEEANPVPSFYLTGLGVDSTGAVREREITRVPNFCSNEDRNSKQTMHLFLLYAYDASVLHIPVIVD